jgi:DNA-directed RNA polymerase specialized sigma24 family protein
METPIHQTFTAALNALPSAERRLLILHADPGATAERVGAALGITTAEARVGLLHARRAIRRQLSDRLRLSA